jgi:signal transduction histidine kinase
VLANLAGNAIKFTPAGGSVTIEAVAAGDELRFSVRDTGPGIPEAERPRLFDRYWQPTRTAAKGTGLGLYIARGIVLAHGGRIWVDSRVGAGSTFSFTLPVAPQAPAHTGAGA